MDFETLTHELTDGVLLVRLHRPDQLNAFTVPMAQELEQTFRDVNDDDAVRAVIVTGSGRAFCAGMDLNRAGNVFGLDESLTPGLADMENLDDPAIAQVRDTGGLVNLALYDCTKPVIAAINGPAVGIGATMTLPMDRRIMAEDARIGLVFGRLGVVPEATSTWYLAQLLGVSAAIDLTLRADILSAADALEVGLVDEVVAADELLERAFAVANAWTRGRSPVAIALTKQMVRRNAAQPHPVEAHRVDSLAMFWTSIADGKEGVAAFLEKRTPDFTSRASQMPPFYADWIRQTNQPS